MGARAGEAGIERQRHRERQIDRQRDRQMDWRMVGAVRSQWVKVLATQS